MLTLMGISADEKGKGRGGETQQPQACEDILRWRLIFYGGGDGDGS